MIWVGGLQSQMVFCLSALSAAYNNQSGCANKLTIKPRSHVELQQEAEIILITCWLYLQSLSMRGRWPWYYWDKATCHQHREPPAAHLLMFHPSTWRVGLKNVSMFLLWKLLQFWSWTILYGSNGIAALSGKIKYVHNFGPIIVVVFCISESFLVFLYFWLLELGALSPLQR